MGARGPAAAPAGLRLLAGRGNGTDSGGRKVAPPPAFRRIAPDPPTWLPREAKAEWRRVAPGLQRLDLLKEEDRASFAAYCDTWSRYVDATRAVQREGLTCVAAQGVIQHPCVKIALSLSRELRLWANQFGLTPSAENALTRGGSAEDGDANPFAGAAGS